MASPVQQPSDPVSLVTDRLLVDNSVLKIMFVSGIVVKLPVLGCSSLVNTKRIKPADHCHFRVTK